MMGYVPVSYINHIGSEPPSNPFEGMIWFDTASNTLNIYRNASWSQISSNNFTYEGSLVFIGIQPPQEQNVLFWLDTSNPNQPILKYKYRNIWMSISNSVSNNVYSRIQVGNSFPTTNINEGDLFYRTSDNKLFIRHANNWLEVDWQRLVRSSPEWIAGRLRIENNQLQISPNGINWFNCIPAVGANTVELVSVDNSSYSLLYWIPPGVTAIVRNANHLPIVYTPAVEPAFIGTAWTTFTYHWWAGLRVSNTTISDGYAQVAYGGGGRGNTSLNIIVLLDFDANASENWGYFTINIRSNQRWLVHGFCSYGFSDAGIIHSHGTAPTTSYWFGTWWTEVSGSLGTRQQFTMTRIALTRLA